jgi:hypothetical protein
MTAYPHIWQNWIDALHRWGLREVAAGSLEALGPLSIIAAQAIYMSQPLLGRPARLSALASLLEDPQQVSAFVSMLRVPLRGNRG